MKTISRLLTLLLLVAISFTNVSCGGDDNDNTVINPNEQPNNNGNNNNNNNNNNDDDTEEASIVGTWKYVFDKNDGKECYWMMILEANGNGYFFEEDWYDGIAERYAEKFTYKYKSPYLTIYYSDGYKDIVNVEFLNDDVIETDIDDECSIWKRQKGAYDNTSIIGYWQCDYWVYDNDIKDYENRFDGMKFNSNGTGCWYENTGDNLYSGNFTYEYDAPILTIEEDGDIFESEIKFISDDIFLYTDDSEDEVYPYVKSEEPEIKDNDDEISLLGTWRNDWGTGARSYTAYSFFEDGTGLYFDKGNGAQRFTYTYDEQVSIISVDYVNYYDEEQITISRITSDEFVIDGEVYKKTELTYSMLILGEWLFHLTEQGDGERKTRVVFYSDWDVEGTGTYEAKDYYDYKTCMEESEYSFSGLDGIVSGTWSINGDKLSITGQSQIAGEYIIEGLVANGCRLVRASNPDEYPYIVGGYHKR